MIEKERFTTTICDECRHILKDRDSNLSVTLRGVCHEEELALLDTLNNLHKENEELKKENNMLKTTIARNEQYIQQLTHKGGWK